MSNADERHERDELAAALLARSGIPIPAVEIGKVSAMYFSAEDARNTLRSVQQGETEPMIVFSSGMVHRDEQR